MIRLPFLALAWALPTLAALPLAGAELPAVEAAALVDDVRQVMTAYEQGDYDPLISRTHHSIVDLVGTPEVFARMTRAAAASLQARVHYLRSAYGTPTELVDAGEEEVCFVPRLSVIEMGGAQLARATFLVAIRPKSGGAWHFLDGAAMRQTPELLWELLPALPTDAPVPPNTVERIDLPSEDVPEATEVAPATPAGA